jgi:hypothetical protein
MSPLDDFSRYATIIPEEHLPALARNLKRIPDFSWLISSPHPELERLQGDLLVDFPTVFLDEAGTPRSRQFTVMILNNTCDLPDERLDFVTAAPVVDFNIYRHSQSLPMVPSCCFTWYVRSQQDCTTMH